MEWVAGQRLNDFVADSLDRPHRLQALGGIWTTVSEALRDTHAAHADLQHGNVLLVPDDAGRKLSLKLVDYDGMYVPALAHIPPAELGHPAFQHPQRARDRLYGADVDRFSHLVIYTAVRALAAQGRALWQQYDNGDNLLFRPADFERPRDSQLLQELWASADPAVRAMVGRLILATQRPLSAAPWLDQIVRGQGVAELSAAEQNDVERTLGRAGKRTWSAEQFAVQVGDSVGRLPQVAKPEPSVAAPAVPASPSASAPSSAVGPAPGAAVQRPARQEPPATSAASPRPSAAAGHSASPPALPPPANDEINYPRALAIAVSAVVLLVLGSFFAGAVFEEDEPPPVPTPAAESLTEWTPDDRVPEFAVPVEGIASDAIETAPSTASAPSAGPTESSPWVDFREVGQLTGYADGVRSVAFSPDGLTLASGGDDGTIKLWDAAAGMLRQTLQGQAAPVYAVAFSPDGRTLASGSIDGAIKLWDAATGTLLQTPEGHSILVFSVAFSPDGQTLASGSADTTIRLWDVASGTLRQTLPGHAGGVYSVAFSPDGQTLASGSDDRTIRLWRRGD